MEAHKKKSSMRYKLIIFFVIVALLPLLAQGIWTRAAIKSQLTENVYARDSLLASKLSDKIDQMIKNRVELAKTMAAIPQIINMDPEEIKPMIKAVKEKNPDIDVVGVINSQGLQIARSDDNQLLDLKDRSYFKEGMAGKEYAVSEVLLSKTTQLPSIMVAAPVRDDANIRGVIHITLKLDAVNELISSARTGETGTAFIVDTTGKAVAHPNNQFSVEQTDLSALAPVKEGLSGKTGSIEFVDKGKTILASYTQTPFLKWVVVTQKSRDEALAGVNQLLGNSLVILLLGTLFAILMGILLSNRTVKPIAALKEGMLAIADGNLTRNFEIQSGDEIGLLAASMDKTRENLKEIVKQLLETGNQLYHSSGQLSERVQQTSAGTEETASTISEIAGTVDQVASNGGKLAEHARSASAMAAEGKRGIELVTGQMSSIAKTTNEVSDVISDLAHKSREITQIVDVITSIADQTNLLALNAAIEAARAGEQGRGFAVVADEVRHLAEQSGHAADEIRVLIADIQGTSVKAVNAMSEGARDVANGTSIVAETGEVFTSIITTVEDLSSQVQGVATATEQMSTAVQNVAASAEEQTAAMEEVSAATDTLYAMAEKLKGLAGRFQV